MLPEKIKQSRVIETLELFAAAQSVLIQRVLADRLSRRSSKASLFRAQLKQICTDSQAVL